MRWRRREGPWGSHHDAAREEKWETSEAETEDREGVGGSLRVGCDVEKLRNVFDVLNLVAGAISMYIGLLLRLRLVVLLLHLLRSCSDLLPLTWVELRPEADFPPRTDALQIDLPGYRHVRRSLYSLCERRSLFSPLHDI